MSVSDFSVAGTATQTIWYQESMRFGIQTASSCAKLKALKRPHEASQQFLFKERSQREVISVGALSPASPFGNNQSETRREMVSNVGVGVNPTRGTVLGACVASA